VPDVEHIYIAASARDARFTRICVASVRYFYPDVSIQLLVGGPLKPGLAEELRRYWNVGVKNLPRRDYGWGFVKLEPLFEARGGRFLVLDSDTVMAGPALEWAASDSSDFIVDDEQQTVEGIKSIYYDAQKSAQEGVPLPEPKFVFNSGQWVGVGGAIDRDAFDGLIKWGNPPKLANPRVFKNGEQGVLNFVLNQKAHAGAVGVARVPLMRWPGHGLEGLDVTRIASKKAAPCIIHWAGMKKARQSDMVGADILRFFEGLYYQRLPLGTARRLFAGCVHSLSHWRSELKTRIKLRSRLMFSR
jgi:hypothetical protein